MRKMKWTAGTVLSGLAVLGMATAMAPQAAARGRDDGRRTAAVSIRIGDITLAWRDGDNAGYYDRDGRRYRRDGDIWSRYDRGAWYRYDERHRRWNRDDHDDRYRRDSRSNDRWDNRRDDRGRSGGYGRDPRDERGRWDDRRDDRSRDGRRR